MSNEDPCFVYTNEHTSECHINGNSLTAKLNIDRVEHIMKSGNKGKILSKNSKRTCNI